MKEFGEFVQSVGFPIAVAAVLLWDRLTISNRLVKLLTRIAAKLEGVETKEIKVD